MNKAKFIFFLCTLSPFASYANGCENFEQDIPSDYKSLKQVFISNYSEKLSFLEFSSKLTNCHPIIGYKFLAEAYLVGELVGKDIDKALGNLNEAANHGNVDAMVSLANILSNNEKFLNLDKAIGLYEEAALKGNYAAKFNLFLLFQKGKYKDSAKAVSGLLEVAQSGNEEAAILFSQFMIDLSEQTKNEGFVRKALEVMESTKFEQEKAVAEYILAQLYSFEEFSNYNEELRDAYLKSSSDLGFARAKELWSEYQRLKELEKEESVKE